MVIDVGDKVVSYTNDLRYGMPFVSNKPINILVLV